MQHEELLIESYAYGYLAHKLDQYSPVEVVEHTSNPFHDICFVSLMRLHEVMELRNLKIVPGMQKNFSQYEYSYNMGYEDSKTEQPSKVAIPNKTRGDKVWIYPVCISHMAHAWANA